jgi:hypothetical protein
MTMPKLYLTFATWAALLTLSLQSAGAAELVYLSIKDAPAENGKKREMEFREIERTAEASVVEVTMVSGGSVSSSMFTMRGMCAITRARGAKYFSTQRIASNPTRYKVVFPADPPPAGPEPSNTYNPQRVISVADCQLLRM